MRKKKKKGGGGVKRTKTIGGAPLARPDANGVEGDRGFPEVIPAADVGAAMAQDANSALVVP